MTTFYIELTPEQEARLIATASTQGIAPETMVRQFVIERLPEVINEGKSAAPAKVRENITANTPQEASLLATQDAELVDEGGVLVLARLSVMIDDWDSLVERERETRIDALHAS